MAKIFYLPVTFILDFETEVFIDNYPLFVVRSILGNSLRRICCISHTKKCDECEYNKTCTYASIFETIIDSNNQLLPGTNRSSHPFSLADNCQIQLKNEISQFSFTITLFGTSIKTLPYIYAAFVRAGELGMFKNRTKFKVSDVLINGKSVLIDELQIQNDINPFIFEYKNSENNYSGEILVELKTPLRFKTKGKYSIDFSAEDFFKALFRRYKTLMILYSENLTEEIQNYNKCNSEIVERKLFWKDFSHYSARQKNAMELGGVIGTFKLKGSFNDFELALLNLAKISNAGKNTVFGLGQIDYWEKLR